MSRDPLSLSHMHGPGWLHFFQSPAHDDPNTGDRALSVAVVEDGVTVAVTRDGRPHACTISFEDWDLLVQHVELERT